MHLLVFNVKNNWTHCLFVFKAKQHIGIMYVCVVKASNLFGVCICLFSNSKSVVPTYVCVFNVKNKLWTHAFVCAQCQSVLGPCTCL